MTVHNLGEQDSVANQFLSEVRDVAIQTDRLRFRHNLLRLGEVMAYKVKEVKTPLGKKKISLPDSEIVLVTIMRAGLPFLDGFQRVFDKAETGFISSYRVEGKSKIRIETGYLATPRLDGKTVLLVDTMLATGRSVADAVTSLMTRGKPKYLHLCSVIAAPEGIEYLKKNIKVPTSLWTFSIDEKLDSRFYIVPGLGDAGDLSFGPK